MATSRETIARIVNNNFGTEIAQIATVTSGEVNEVYQLQMQGGGNAILRISHSNEDTFTPEGWAIEQARNIGVPVAKILALGAVDGGRYMFQEVINGKLLSAIIAEEPPDSERIRAIASAAGATLKQIHIVKTRGYGYIENGAGSYPDKYAWMSRTLCQEEKYAGLMASMSVSPETTRKAFAVLRDGVELLMDDSQLLHGDFVPDNIMVDAHDNIAGVIDFEEAASGDIALDFTAWAFEHEGLLAALIAGYDGEDLGNHFTQRFRVVYLYKCLHMLNYYVKIAQQPLQVQRVVGVIRQLVSTP